MRISTVCLSKHASDCAPKGWQLFTVTHWIPMRARIDDPKTNDQKQNLSILLSESASDCVPKDRRLFAASHWILIELHIDNLKTKEQKRIITVCLSRSASDWSPGDWWIIRCISLNARWIAYCWPKDEVPKANYLHLSIKAYERLCSEWSAAIRRLSLNVCGVTYCWTESEEPKAI